MPKEKTNLVIVESPSKAKTIGKYLGPDYVVKASMGHLRDLPKSTLGVDIEHDFEPEYRPLAGKESIIKDLRDSAKKAKTSISRPTRTARVRRSRGISNICWTFRTTGRCA